MNKKLYVLAGFLILSAIVVELVLRFAFGFCNTVLFKTDPNFEYIPIPQSTIRFRKFSYYNSFSQRNREISETDTTIILGFGDSVLNGGVMTEQDSLATTLLTNALSAEFKKSVLVTNISAGSWGPDNCFAYLKKYGNFGAKLMLLVVSSHDAFDTMDFKQVVNIHHSYPSQQYKLGVWELLDRYLIPKAIKIMLPQKKKADDSEDLLINKQKQGSVFNPGFSEFVKYSDSTGIPLIVYLHADKNEKIANEYNSQGKKIIDFLEKNKISLIKELNYRSSVDDYRDGIHLSEKGQRMLFRNTKDTLAAFLEKCSQ